MMETKPRGSVSLTGMFMIRILVIMNIRGVEFAIGGETELVVVLELEGREREFSFSNSLACFWLVKSLRTRIFSPNRCSMSIHLPSQSCGNEIFSFMWTVVYIDTAKTAIPPSLVEPAVYSK